MSYKKIAKWIDLNNDKTCWKINQKYYTKKEAGLKVNLLSGHFIILIIKRLFFVFFTLFRSDRNPYQPYWKSKNLKDFLKRIIGLYKFVPQGLLAPPKIFKPLIFQAQANPQVSIIIAVHNNWAYTYNCLLSILQQTRDVAYEILLINDFSTDDTSLQIKNIQNITFIENTENLGFLKSCNKAAKQAKGTYLCFLNNDTQVTSGWLSSKLAVFTNDPETGLVGSKLIYPYGLLQEAGGLVDSHGNPSNYGRFDNPEMYKYNFLRETDYCSGASITLLKSDFENLNGFEEQFAPAYYEDTDLCFNMRYQLHKKVYYQPFSQIIHFEGISSGKIIKRGSVKEYQKINAEKFKKKWARVFKQFPTTTSFDNITSKFNQKKTILFVDIYLPEHDANSGSRRIFELIKIFRSLNFNVIFLPNDGIRREPYFSELANMGVCILYTLGKAKRPIKELKEVLNKINYAWISRPNLNETYAPYIKNNPAIAWIYDTVDLHFIRMERGLKFQNSASTEVLQEIEKIKTTEISFAKEADITIAITETESETLKNLGAKRVEIVTNIHVPFEGANKHFHEKENICFIGGYDHQPNVDAVVWLVNEIMPLVWKQLPDVKLTLLGSNPNSKVLALQSSNVIVTGYLEKVDQYFIDSRICVAPLRYGAGMKGKIGHSLEYGLPVITTTIGSEGMNLKHGYHALIADTTETFAQEIINLYTDEELWNRISINSFSAIEKYAPANIKKELIEILKLPSA